MASAGSPAVRPGPGMEFVGIALSGKGQGLTAFRHRNNCSLAVRCQDAVKKHAGDS